MRKSIYILVVLYAFAFSKLNAQAVVGTIPGSLSVSGSGEATYSIPIECPTGIQGLQPNISLNYNSHTQNRAVGIGWSIGGASIINRTNKTIYTHDSVSGINMDDECFVLDGRRLLVKNKVQSKQYSGYTMKCDLSSLFSSLYGQIWNEDAGSTYETENKTYQKIETFGIIPYITRNCSGTTGAYWAATSMGPRYFIITTKDGKILEYKGIQENEKTIEPEETINTEWGLSKVTDKNGNYASYSYIDYEGQALIKKIEYTGNSNNNTLPFCSIIFNYDEKAKIERYYISSSSYLDQYLLKNIQVIVNNTVLKQYDLSYEYKNEKYYLTSIDLTGLDNQKYNSTTFQWGNNNTTISVNSKNIPSVSNNADKYWLSTDLDGNGLNDIVTVFPKQIIDGNGNVQNKNLVQTYNTSVDNTGNISFDEKTAVEVTTTDFSYSDIKSDNSNILFGDLNGIGQRNIIIPGLEGTDKKTLAFQIIGGSTIEKQLTHGNTRPLVAIADFNNDGIDEILYIEKENNGTSYPMSIYYTNRNKNRIWIDDKDNSIVTNPQKLICDDFDNDGLIDLLVLSDAGYVFYKNSGGGKTADGYVPIHFMKEPGINSNTLNALANTIKKGDFNGDGSADLLINENLTGYWKIAYGIGNGYLNINSAPLSNISAKNESNTTNDDNKEDCIVADFNNDGKSDVIIVDPVYDQTTGTYIQTNIIWYASNGNGFDITKTFTVIDENYSFKKFNTVGDFNGDGRKDILTYGSDIYNGNVKSDDVFISSAINSNFEADLVTQITDGMGNTKKINYQPITTLVTADNKTFYTKGNSSVYPVRDLQIPLYCVNKISTPDGQGGWSDTEYSYAEACTELTGKGFLGFKKLTVTNNLVNRKTVTSTNMDLTYYSPSKITSEVFTANDTPLSKTETTFTNSKTNHTYESKPLQQKVFDYLNNLSSITDYLSFDQYGNNTSIKTTQGDLISTQSATYIQRGSLYPDKPETVTLTRTQNNETFTRIWKFEYDDNGNLTKETTDVGDVNQKITEYKNKNSYGQYTKTEVSANGITRSSSISMTPSGRFIQSKTDVLGQTTSYQWDETKGILQTETNRIGTTSYAYNGMGQLASTTLPDGNSSSITLQWAGSNSYGALYSAVSTASGNAPSTVWYDALGRQIVQETYGLNGKISRVFTQYRTDGQTDRVSQPTFGTQPDAWSAVYDYYTDGRIKSVTTPTGISSTVYSGKTTTVTTPEGTQETTLNSAGQTFTQKINGKTVTYAYYASGLLKSSTPEGGQPISMEYNHQGNRTKLTDPDLGISTAYFNGWGELKWEKLTNNAAQGEITTEYTYNPTTGLPETRARNGETTSYIYDNNKRISTITIPGQHLQTVTYDDYDRVKTLTEVINNEKTLTKEVVYDAYGRIQKEIFPTGYYTENRYDQYGNLTEITDSGNHSIIKYTDANARGQITKLLKGSKESAYGYDAQKAMLTSIATPGVVNLAYQYDTKNNLYARADNLTAQREVFTYDTQNRLTNWDEYRNGTLALQNSINYNISTGNIESKSDIGGTPMYYGAGGKPHALASIAGVRSDFPTDELNVTYTDFRKIKTLTEGDKTYTITYGVDDQRRKSSYTPSSGGSRREVYYFGNYEEETDALGNTKKIHYLSGGAIYIISSPPSGEPEGATLYYGYTDNQGSLIALTDASGNVVEKYAYDPWGARRNPADWTQKDTRTGWVVNRGYTGHEHIPSFGGAWGGYINMNGRVYDPATAQFFSPDPFLQDAGNWLNYNRYGYVFNNPLKYTDPSGYRTYSYGQLDGMIYRGNGDVNEMFGGHGGGGGGMGNWWNEYTSYKNSGGMGDLSSFLNAYDERYYAGPVGGGSGNSSKGRYLDSQQILYGWNYSLSKNGNISNLYIYPQNIINSVVWVSYNKGNNNDNWWNDIKEVDINNAFKYYNVNKFKLNDKDTKLYLKKMENQHKEISSTVSNGSFLSGFFVKNATPQSTLVFTIAQIFSLGQSAIAQQFEDIYDTYTKNKNNQNGLWIVNKTERSYNSVGMVQSMSYEFYYPNGKLLGIILF